MFINKAVQTWKERSCSWRCNGFQNFFQALICEGCWIVNVNVLNCWLAAGITRHLSYKNYTFLFFLAIIHNTVISLEFFALQDTVWTLMKEPFKFTLILCRSIAIIGKQCAKKQTLISLFSVYVRDFSVWCADREQQINVLQQQGLKLLPQT